MSTVRRGTANVLVGLTGVRVQHRFRTLAAATDVLALQEWPRTRAWLLNDLRSAWTWHRPVLGGGPIGVRRDLGEQRVSCRALMLARPGYVGRSPGRTSRAVLGPSWATRLKTRRSDGRVIVRYNIHLTAGVQAGHDGYRRDHASARRVARHRTERHTLQAHVDRDLRRGFLVEVYGDTNYHRMPIQGLIPWWRLQVLPTFGSRTIDGIWTQERPDSVRTLPPLVPGEHRHVITHTEERHP